MMRGRKAMSIAVRNSQGTIVVHEEALTAKIYTRKWGQWPFVRGLALLWDALGLGMRALMWSADVSMQEDDVEEQIEFSGSSRTSCSAVCNNRAADNRSRESSPARVRSARLTDTEPSSE